MGISKYQLKKIAKLKRRAYILYKQGMTVRDVGAVVGRSRSWVSDAVREIEKAEELMDRT